MSRYVPMRPGMRGSRLPRRRLGLPPINRNEWRRIMKARILTAGIGALAMAMAMALVLAAPAQATTIDFTGAAAVDYGAVPQTYGDSAEADLSYRTLAGGNNWGQTAVQSAN